MVTPSGAERTDDRLTRWARLWAQPDVVLLDASADGERLSARIRFTVALLVAGVAAVDLANRGTSGESYGWNVVAFLGLAGALGLMVMVDRGFYRWWLGFATSALDVSIVTAGLVAFLYAGEPQLAVNSRVVYEAYFLALAATCLRYDPKICVWAGTLAVLEYVGVLSYASMRWDLADPDLGSFSYGPFSWHAQLARMVILAAFTGLATIIVIRARQLHRLSTSDFLTGLHNRGYFDERIREEVVR